MNKVLLPAVCRNPEFWHGVDFAIIGDSITEFDDYQHKLNGALGFKSLYVDAKGGTGIAGTDENSFYSRVGKLPKNADFIFIFGGTNDWHYNHALGNHGDGTPETFYGALTLMIDRIRATNPDARIVIATPLKRKMQAEEPAGIDLNKNSNTMPDFVNAIKTVCENKSVVVMDLYCNSGINSDTIACYTLDGLHPNPAGFEVLAEEMLEFFTDTGCEM